MSNLEHFLELDLRVGTIVEAEPFREARKPSFKLKIDFGSDIGMRRSSAQITENYTPEMLVGTQVVALVNVPEKRIAGYKSQVLVLGAVNAAGTDVVLLGPGKEVPNGRRIA